MHYKKLDPDQIVLIENDMKKITLREALKMKVSFTYISEILYIEDDMRDKAGL